MGVRCGITQELSTIMENFPAFKSRMLSYAHKRQMQARCSDGSEMLSNGIIGFEFLVAVKYLMSAGRGRVAIVGAVLGACRWCRRGPAVCLVKSETASILFDTCGDSHGRICPAMFFPAWAPFVPANNPVILGTRNPVTSFLDPKRSKEDAPAAHRVETCMETCCAIPVSTLRIKLLAEY